MFKVGNLIKCVGFECNGFFNIGELYTIKDIQDGLFVLVDKNNTRQLMDKYFIFKNFLLVEELSNELNSLDYISYYQKHYDGIIEYIIGDNLSCHLKTDYKIDCININDFGNNDFSISLDVIDIIDGEEEIYTEYEHNLSIEDCDLIVGLVKEYKVLKKLD